MGCPRRGLPGPRGPKQTKGHGLAFSWDLLVLVRAVGAGLSELLGCPSEFLEGAVEDVSRLRGRRRGVRLELDELLVKALESLDRAVVAVVVRSVPELV